MERGAGIVVIRFFDGKPRLLGLRVFGRYDLPKGRIEQGETSIDAARRETREEAGLEDLTFRWGDASILLENMSKHHPKVVQMFIAETNSDPRVCPNPVTGRYEHHSHAWLEFEEANQGLHVYLRPVVPWAASLINGPTHIER